MQTSSQEAWKSRPTQARAFIDALQEAETSRDATRLVALFEDDAELQSVAFREPLQEANAPRHFWQSYLSQFERVRSRFDRVAGGDDEVVLEWTSDCVGHDGHDFSYRGVSLVSFAGDKVKRFATYFDTAQFLKKHH